VNKNLNDLNAQLKFQPLTRRNWNLFEGLMGERGGCGGCWCMSPRLSSKEFSENKYNGNKRMMQDIVTANKPVGLIATRKNEPVGWMAFAPREDYTRIERSRALKRIDDKPVWSITCFFVKKEFRKLGLSQLLIKGAVDYAKKNKIKTLEAYPFIPYSDKVPAAFLWFGVLSAFTNNGFKVVRQNGKSRAMVRLDVPLPEAS
jgi:GNAT superfamily N-acetyltransferase